MQVKTLTSFPATPPLTNPLSSSPCFKRYQKQRGGGARRLRVGKYDEFILIFKRIQFSSRSPPVSSYRCTMADVTRLYHNPVGNSRTTDNLFTIVLPHSQCSSLYFCNWVEILPLLTTINQAREGRLRADTQVWVGYTDAPSCWFRESERSGSGEF